MHGINAFYLTPSGSQENNNSTGQFMVEGGSTSSSHFVTEMNQFSTTAHLLLLTRGNGVDVAFLKDVENVFDGFTKKQILYVFPKKKDKLKLSHPDVHAIADRISRKNGGNGVSRCKCIRLTTFQEIVKALQSVEPRAGAKKNMNLSKVKAYIANYDMLYHVWKQQDGDHRHMYQQQRALVVSELADFARAGDFARMNAALALLTSDTADNVTDQLSTIFGVFQTKIRRSSPFVFVVQKIENFFGRRHLSEKFFVELFCTFDIGCCSIGLVVCSIAFCTFDIGCCSIGLVVCSIACHRFVFGPFGKRRVLPFQCGSHGGTQSLAFSLFDDFCRRCFWKKKKFLCKPTNKQKAEQQA
jgi:hypothetical protein